MESATLYTKDLTTGYEQRTILDHVTISLPPEKISVIIGANGCGKSTLLKSFARLLNQKSGTIFLDHQDIRRQSSKAVAKRLGLLPQTSVAPSGLIVTDLVMQGRFPYRRFMQNITQEDFRAVEEAMERMGICHLANRRVDELSGGQRQRVWIAMALAQQTDILLLDEPITYLDVAYQVEILDLLKELNHKKRTTICMVLHDINLTMRCADYIFAMKDGKVIAQGSPEKIITPLLLKEVFQLNSTVLKDPISGKPIIIPIGKHF